MFLKWSIVRGDRVIVTVIARVGTRFSDSYVTPTVLTRNLSTMATENNHASKPFPRSTGCVIAATGFFMSTAATLGSAMGGHPYAHLQIGMGVVLFAFGAAMVALAFRERKRERDTFDTFN